VRRDAAGGVRIAAPVDRSPLVVRAATALAHLTRQAEAPGARLVDVQPVVQVRDAAAYRRWRTEREAVWRTQGGRYTTAGWPAELPADRLAAVLLPLPHGAARSGGGKPGRMVADPLFSTGLRVDGAGPDEIALGLVAQWLRQAASGSAALRVAAPILEPGDGARRVLDLGLDWPLAAAVA